MRHLLLLSSAVLLGVTLFPQDAASLSAHATGLSSTAAVDTAAPEAADFYAPVTTALSAMAAQADRPTCFGRRATLVGTDGADTLVGTPEGDVIVAGAGNDVIRGRGGVDFVCAGDGDDDISGGPNPGVFTLTKDPPRGDRLSGEEGNDRIFDDGDGFRDRLRGGPGDDVLRTGHLGYAESRTVEGGPGADRIVSASTDAVLYGGPGPDHVTSRGHNDFVAGEQGPDVVTLEGSGDTMLGLDADGDQVVRGGRVGYIVLLFHKRISAIEVDLAAGTVRQVGATTTDVLSGLTPPKKKPHIVVYGTDGDDLISGLDYTTEQLYGGRGNDVLAGRGGGDILVGNQGNDVLDGGDGDDMVDGGSGSDTCINAERVSGCSP